MKLAISTAVGVLLLAVLAHGADNFASVDTRITAEKLGLPKGNARTSEPFVTRIYKTDDLDRILDKQPEGYPLPASRPRQLIRMCRSKILARWSSEAKSSFGLKLASEPG
jgi:hypothetical protein